MTSLSEIRSPLSCFTQVHSVFSIFSLVAELKPVYPLACGHNPYQHRAAQCSVMSDELTHPMDLRKLGAYNPPTLPINALTGQVPFREQNKVF
jgi:hypothetical protein